MRRRGNTITVNTHVEMSDWMDVDIELDEVIDEIEDDDLIKELSRRKINISSDLKGNDVLTKYSICDIFGVNYHTDKGKLKELMNIYIDGL